jgi:alpha-tubulin suppressor-like RCC1 family protein
LVLTGNDTKGEIQSGQIVSLTTMLTKKGTLSIANPTVYSQADAEAVTVVSAPAVDVIMNSQDSCQFPQSVPIARWAATASSGKLYAVPCGLTYPGYAQSKGVSTQGEWSGSIDVSSFPENTQFTLNGEAVSAVDGKIPVENITGSAAVGYTLPQGWPAQDPGSLMTYDVSVSVDSDSFSTATQLNNGTGTQPGDGLSKNTSTADSSTGAQKGKSYPNNDYWGVPVYNPPPVPPGAIMSKEIYGPRDNAYTIWDSENIVEGQSPSSYRGESCYTTDASKPCNSVARSTQLLDKVLLHADVIFNSAGTDDVQLTTAQIAKVSGTLIIGDVWDSTQQSFDVSRLVDFGLTDPSGAMVASSHYQIQYATTPKTVAQVQDINDSGWITGTPTAAATAVRLLVDEVSNDHVIPFFSEEGTGTFALQIPLTINPNLGPTGTPVNDTGVFAPANVESNDPSVNAGIGSGSMQESVILVLPATPVLSLEDSITKITDRQGTATDNDLLVPPVASGSKATYTLHPSVKSMPNSNPVDATVTVTLDPCQSAPTLANGSPWTMSVTPGTGTCGQPGAQGATLTFTLDDAVPRWSNLVGDGTFPNIVYTATSDTITPNNETITNPATLSVTGVPQDASAQASYQSLTADDVAQNIEQTEEHTKTVADGGSKSVGLAEITKQLHWNVDIYSFTQHSGLIDSIVILPKNGGDSCTTGDSAVFDSIESSLNGYTGAHCSDYSGSYTLASATFDMNNTSGDTQLFCTTQANPTFDAKEDGTWIPYSAAACANATALRVERPAGSSDASAVSLDITLTPNGNQTGDTYMMWLASNESAADVTADPVWPAEIDVVSSSLSGTVWWDDDSDGAIDDSESEIAGITVCLYNQNADGSLGAKVTTAGNNGCLVTDANGFYDFENILSGTYTVRMTRDTSIIPNTVHTKYGQDLAVTETYSFKNMMGSKASLDATAPVPFAGNLPDVNYGWVKPDPSIQLDKSLVSSKCSATASTCTAMWQIDVANNGNQPVTPSVTDTLSQKPIAESVQKGYAVTHSFTFITEGYSVTAALDSDGNIWTWGNGSSGQLGNGKTTKIGVPTQVTGEGTVNAATTTGVKFTSIQFDSPNSSSTTAIALDSDGHIWTWGDSTHGQLGNGSTSTRLSPVQVTAGVSGVTFKSVQIGNSTVVALDTDGHLWAWGENNYGQVGNGATQDVSTPVEVKPDTTFVQVQTSMYSTIALDSNGHIWTWGNNQYGQLGNGTTTNATTPIDITPSGKTFTSVTAGSSSMFAVDSAGSVWGWGSNSVDQLTAAAGGPRVMTPVQIVGSDSVNPTQSASKKTFSYVYEVRGSGAADGSTFAIDTDGYMWMWGDNSLCLSGRLNCAATGGATMAAPYPTSNSYQVLSVSGYLGSAAYLDSTGLPWLWGDNTYGQLGVGDTANHMASGIVGPDELYYNRVDDGVKIVSLQTNYYTTVAVDSLGRIWTWGNNSAAQIGNGKGGGVETNPVNVTPPTKIVNGPFMDVTPGANNDVDVDLPTLQPGQSTSMLVSATFAQKDFDQVVANQAYVTAANTPIDGLLDENGFTGKSVPDPVVPPAEDDYDSLGVPGNLTCTTNVDAALMADGSVDTSTGFTTDVTEDSCDQVPALFPAYTVAPSLGNLTGQTWYDANKDGIEAAAGGANNTGEYMVSGITATLTQVVSGTDAPYTQTMTTSTGSDGQLDCDGNQLGKGEYAFCDIPIGNYTVQFGIPSQGADPESPAGSYAFTRQTAWQAVATTPPSNLNSSGQTLSLPVQETGLTGNQQVVVDATTTNVNAGLISTTAALSVVKDSAAHSDEDNTVTPQLAINQSTGKSDSVTIAFTVTNTGDDVLTNIAWTDATLDGVAVDWASCTYGSGTITAGDTQTTGSASSYYMLAPGDSFTCTGTLPAMAAASHHADTVTVTAQGQLSHINVTGNDPWSVSVPLNINIEKLSQTSTNQWGPVSGSQWQISTSPSGGAADGVMIVLNPSVSTDNAWTVTGLEPNVNYYLTETSAPLGYSLLAEPIEFSVNAGGGISLISGQGSFPNVVATSQFGTGGTVGQVEGLENLPVLSVRDVPTLKLPFTGGSGTLVFQVVAAMLVILAVVLWLVNERKRAGGHRQK